MQKILRNIWTAPYRRITQVEICLCQSKAEKTKKKEDKLKNIRSKKQKNHKRYEYYSDPKSVVSETSTLLEEKHN
jgi:uncharacterized membrane protein YgaE (UPF0421/DUF939 family)